MVRSSIVLLACCALLVFKQAEARGIEQNSVEHGEHSGSWGKNLEVFQCARQDNFIKCDLKEECTWCNCSASTVGTACYSRSFAKLLPKKYFTCTKTGPAVQAAVEQKTEPQPLAATACDGRDEGSCISPECVWCTSAAVGASCFTPEQAKKLPSAVFKCKTIPSFVTA